MKHHKGPKLDESVLRTFGDKIRLTRRRATLLLAGAAGAPAAATAQTRPGGTADPVVSALPQGPTPTAEQFYIRRPDDFLLLDVRLNNLRTRGSGENRTIERVRSGRVSRLIVTHQPQAVADEAFVEVTGQEQLNTEDNFDDALPTAPQVANSRIAGVSRVVFTMPSDLQTAPWSLPAFLDYCRSWPMSLDPLAVPAPKGVIFEIFQPATDLQILTSADALSVAKSHLDHMAGALINALPGDNRAAITVAASYASEIVANAITAAATQGRVLSEGEIDREIDQALNRRMGPLAMHISAEHRKAARLAVEANAVSAAIATAQPQTRSLQRRDEEIRPQDQPSITISPQALEAFLALKPHAPAETVTSIELPYRLMQTPLATAGWAHADGPVTRSDRTELWHTRLGRRRADGGVDDQAAQPLRAMWTPDYRRSNGSAAPTPVTNDPSPASGQWALDASDRSDIVKLTAGFDETSSGNQPFTPIPATANRLMLTGLGGWLDLDGQWTTRPTTVNLEAWNHKTAMARDYYVRVVYAGFLFPFGHAASLVKVTERKFQSHNGGRIAPLRQRFFIIVRQPVRTYPGAGQPFGGRDFPFKRIEILTKVTPDIHPPLDDTGEMHVTEFDPVRDAFVPVLNANQDFLFQLAGTDRAGRRIPFSAPLTFVADTINRTQNIDAIAEHYATSRGGARAKRAMNGAVIQYAPQSEGAEGDTNIPTQSITFRGAQRSGGGNPQRIPMFYPGVEDADVELPAVKALLGASQSPTVRYAKIFLDNGFDAPNAAQKNNQSERFLDFLGAAQGPPSLNSAPSDKFAGMMSPNLKPQTLSRNLGLISGDGFLNTPEEFDAAFNALEGADPNFDPSKFLKGAKILGAIAIEEILDAISLFSADSPPPKFVNVEFPDRIETTYAFRQSQLKPDPLDFFNPGPSTELLINSKTVVYRDGGTPEAFVEGSLNDFDVNIFGFVIVGFRLLRFNAVPGKKPDVNIDLKTPSAEAVKFAGPLEFINTLKDLIPGNGFSDPAPVDISPAGLSLRYSIGLPTAQIGICSIQNISFGAGFDLPFTGGPPSVRFNFAERHNPFTITVSMIGGGGFVALTLDTGGMRELEAALEASAQIAFDIGVASGGVYIRLGFYFRWLRNGPNDEEVVFEGYVELGGHLSVLGLISVSLVFYLALGYQKGANETILYGQATLTVEVEILFFSASVKMKVERQFKGSDGDPLFIDLIPNQETWREYCEAFA